MNREDLVPGMIVYTRTCGENVHDLLLKVVKQEAWCPGSGVIDTWCTPLMSNRIMFSEDVQRVFGSNPKHLEMQWTPIPEEILKNFSILKMHLKILGWDGEFHTSYDLFWRRDNLNVP